MNESYELVKKELEIARAELDLVAGISGRAIRIVNKDFSVRRVNRAFTELFGVEPEDAVGKKCWEVHPGPFCHTPNCCLKKILENKSINKLEASRQAEGGFRLACIHEAIPFKAPNGEFLGIIETFWDLSGRIDSNEKYRAIIKSSVEGFWISDLNGIVSDLNDSLCRMLGYSRNELVNKSVFDIIFSGKQAEQKKFVNKLKKQGFVYFETLYKRKDGTDLNIEVSSNYLNFPEGQIFAFVRDISHRGQLDAELKQCRYRLDEMVKERTMVLDKEIKRRTDYTRALVHELKTPLTAIISSSEMLANNGLESHARTRLSKNILRGATTLNKRIEELLDLARSEIGVLKIYSDSINPLTIARGINEDMSVLARSKGQLLIMEAPKELPSIWGDKERIRQILLNLLGNAIKFNRRNGKIIFRLERDESSVIFEVQDEGKGISQSDMSRVFIPYYRLENDRDRLSGLGLGLTLCKELVELHHGHIWIESQEGKGSTFSFSIPLTSNSRG